MGNEKLGQEPAFATQHTIADANDPAFKIGKAGMSKRFYAACNLLPSVISSILSTEKGITALEKATNEANMTRSEFMVSMAYEYADELLKQESK